MDWSQRLIGISGVSIINWAFYIALSTAFAASCAFLIGKISRYAAGSGTAEIKTILGGFMIKGFLGIRTLMAKAVGLPLTVASGLAVGKEGPMIHVASCVGNIFPRFSPKYKNNEGTI
jgi:chloride channel 3/4/5